MKPTSIVLILLSLVIAVIVTYSVQLSKSYDSYTLYRNGINLITEELDENLRIEIAFFNAQIREGDGSANNNYNKANCKFAAELFNKEQPHYAGTIYSNFKVKYWCEKGHFRK